MSNQEEIPKGLWYEIFDFSDRDYGSDWGYILYNDGEEVKRDSGYSKIRWAGDAARKAKLEYKNRLRGE